MAESRMSGHGNKKVTKTYGSRIHNQFEENNITGIEKGKPLMPANMFGVPLKYPLDLENANGHYMIFNVYSRIDKDKESDAVDLNVVNNTGNLYNNTFTSERFFDPTTDFNPWKEGETGAPVKLIKDCVVLYMPEDVSVNYKSNYEAAEIGLVTGLAAAGGDWLKGNMTAGEVAKGIGMQAAAVIEPLLSFGTLGTGAGAMAALQRKTGVAAAPMKEMIFQGIDYRTFNYTFKMNPRNRKEAQEIKKIIDCFTYHMLPEKLGTGAALAYRVPAEFTVRYMYRGRENQYLNQLTFCALTDMKVDYGGGEKYVTYRADNVGAPPVTTSVQLTFQELELIDKRRAIHGTHRTGHGNSYDLNHNTAGIE